MTRAKPSRDGGKTVDAIRFEKVKTKSQYEGLCALWCAVFGDAPAYVDALYETFQSEVQGYVATTPEGRIVSAATCFLCGSFEKKPVYVTYAVCTDEAYRGRGLAGTLVEEIRDDVTHRGGLSIVTPAEPSLLAYYARFGYRPFFFAGSRAFPSQPDHTAPRALPLAIRPLDGAAYNALRENILAKRAHISLSANMLRMIEKESVLADGTVGLFLLGEGEAVCAATQDAQISELLCDPASPADAQALEERALQTVAERLGQTSVVAYTPGGQLCQAMVYGMPEEMQEGYYGFPLQ